jgi:hypothetical protein
VVIPKKFTEGYFDNSYLKVNKLGAVFFFYVLNFYNDHVLFTSMKITHYLKVENSVFFWKPN